MVEPSAAVWMTPNWSAVSPRHPDAGDGHARTGVDVVLQHLPRVHAVHVVGTEDRDVIRLRRRPGSTTGRSRPRSRCVPPRAESLLRRHRRDVVAQQRRHPPGGGDVPVQRMRLVLGQYADPQESAVDHVGQHKVDESIGPSEGHGRLGTIRREGMSCLPSPPARTIPELSVASARTQTSPRSRSFARSSTPRTPALCVVRAAIITNEWPRTTTAAPASTSSTSCATCAP